MTYIEYVNPLLKDTIVALASGSKLPVPVEVLRDTIVAALLDTPSRRLLFSLHKRHLDLAAMRLDSLSEEQYQTLLALGPSCLCDDEYSTLLINPIVLTTLACSLDEQLPGSWWDAVAEIGRFVADSGSLQKRRQSSATNSVSMPYSLAAGSVQNTIDDEFSGLTFTHQDPRVAYWGGTDAINASSTGTIFLWISEEDQFVQVQLRSTSGAFAPMEGDFARVITCESTATLDAMIARLKQNGSQIDQAGCADGMIEVLVRQFAFGRGNRIGLELSRFSPQGERQVRFIVMFTPTVE